MDEQLVIVSAQRESLSAAVGELRTADASCARMRDLDDETVLARVSVPFPELSDRLLKKMCIFVRHISPASVVDSVEGNAGDVQHIAGAIRPLLETLDPARTLSVQTRMLGKITAPYKPFDVNTALSALAHAPLDVRKPEQILSVVIAGNRVYAGVSTPLQNVSNWAGGRRRFAYEPEMVSRAEFKLLEAIEVFGLEMPRGGLAMDLGASPGGWTRVLLEKGMSVVAVDPARLDPRIADDPRVTHERCLAQAYLGRAPMFDVIVNDMKMDVADSVQVMVAVKGKLQKGGLGVITLKLAKDGFVKQAKEGIALLRREYNVVGARQLFHNRSEVTVALKA